MSTENASGDFVGAAVCFAFGVMVYGKLVDLESGVVNSVDVWAPLAYLYNHFGFYPAVSALPAFGVFLLLSGIHKYMKTSGREAGPAENE